MLGATQILNNRLSLLAHSAIRHLSAIFSVSLASLLFIFNAELVNDHIKICSIGAVFRILTTCGQFFLNTKFTFPMAMPGDIILFRVGLLHKRLCHINKPSRLLP